VWDTLLGNTLGVETPSLVEHFYQEFPPPEAPETNWGDGSGIPGEPAIHLPETLP